MTTYITQEQAVALAMKHGDVVAERNGRKDFCFDDYGVRDLCNAAIQAYRDSLVAGVVLPEPVGEVMESRGFDNGTLWTISAAKKLCLPGEKLYTADQLRQAIAADRLSRKC
jgi:hypothetical protein